jgi:glycosyltransferase involved in cell wall biosynthesis
MKTHAEKPLISIVLPVYNCASYVSRTIRSALNQTFSDFELIIINDGSTDRTTEVLNSFTDPRIKIYNQANTGVALARNYGVSLAQGQYIAFLDSDDIWLPEKLQWEVDILEEKKFPVCMVYSAYFSVDNNGRLIYIPHYHKAEDGNAFGLMLNTGCVMIPSTSLIHREIFAKIRGFQTDVNQEDKAFFIEACKSFPAYPSDKRSIIYRQDIGGRYLRVLSNYKEALKSELTLLNAVRQLLSRDEMSDLRRFHIRSLFYRFLIYGYKPHAFKIFPYVDFFALLKDSKGPLALLSLILPVNLLRLVWLTTNNLYSRVYHHWWHRKYQFM